MTRNPEWYRSKIEDGVFIYNEDYRNFYKIKLTGGKTAISRGGITRGDWNEFIETESVGIGSGWDNISHLGNGFWVYKISCNKWPGQPNGIWALDRNNNRTDNLLGWIMGELHRRKNFIFGEDAGKWVVNHPGYAFNNERIDIPERYKWKTVEGKKLCPLKYQLDFFSGGDKSQEGSEYNGDYILVHKLESGNMSKLIFEIKGWHRIRNRGGNPEGIPPSTNLPTDPSIANLPSATPFNPNQFPSSGNLIPNPTGSGEPELHIPDPDFSLDPDLSIDPDFDPDAEPEPEPEPEPDVPPEIDPHDPDNPERDSDFDLKEQNGKKLTRKLKK